jgi:hypothetical protein
MTTTPQLIAGDPGLMAGWEPDAPVGDSVVRRFLHAFGEAGALVAGAMNGTVVRTDDLILSDAGRPAGFSNRVMLLRPLGVVPVAGTLAKIDEATAGGTGEVVIFSAWPTPDLRGQGWKLEGHPPLMLRVPGPGRPPLPAGLEITPVTDAAGLRDVERVAIEGYPLDELRDAPPGSMLNERVLADPRQHLWVARADGRPVAVADALVEAGVVSVNLVATRPGARRRGYGAAVTWAATEVADLPAVLLASDAGRPVYERMGYLTLTRFTCWSRRRPG